MSIVKPKSSVINLANHSTVKEYIEPIKTQETYSWPEARENACASDLIIGFSFTYDWMESGASFF